MQIEVGAGYRRVEIGEILKKGDEYEYCGVWTATADAGYKLDWTGAVYRRAAEPGSLTLSPIDTLTLKALLKFKKGGIPATHSAQLFYDRLFPAPKPETSQKMYRLLQVGEFTVFGDEYFSSGQWQSCREDAVVTGTGSECPVRREIHNYSGGPA